MQKSIFSGPLFFIYLLTLVGCVTTDSNLNEFTKMRENDAENLDIERIGKLKGRSIKYFVVAKLKSVNEQPQEYLEFKSKQFLERSACVNWVSENNNLLTRSLQEYLTNRKKGYFVDSIKCLNVKFYIASNSEREHDV